MPTVYTKPVLLNETGIDMVTALNTIANYYGHLGADNYLFYKVQTTAPSDTELVWFDNSDVNNMVAKFYDGDAWVPFGDSNARFHIGSVAPTSTKLLWFDNSNASNILLKYYNGSTWVTFDINKPPFAVQSSAPSNTNLIWFDNSGSTTKAKFYNNGSWHEFGDTGFNPVMSASINNVNGIDYLYTLDKQGQPTTVGAIAKVNTSTGKIDENVLPLSVHAKVVEVSNLLALYNLTASDVNLGDIVKVDDSGDLFIVKNTSSLSTSSGYEKLIALHDENGNNISEYIKNINWDGGSDISLVASDGNSIARAVLRFDDKLLSLEGGTLTGNLQFDNANGGDISSIKWISNNNANTYKSFSVQNVSALSNAPLFMFNNSIDSSGETTLATISDYSNKVVNPIDNRTGMGILTTNIVSANEVNANNLHGQLLYSDLYMSNVEKEKFISQLTSTLNTTIQREGLTIGLPTLTYKTLDSNTAHNVTTYVPLNSDGYIDPAYIPASSMSTTHFITQTIELASPSFNKDDWKNGDIVFSMAGDGINPNDTASKMYYVVNIAKISSSQYLEGIREFTVSMANQSMGDGMGQTIHTTYLKDLSFTNAISPGGSNVDTVLLNLINGNGSIVKSIEASDYFLPKFGGSIDNYLNVYGQSGRVISNDSYYSAPFKIGINNTDNRLSFDSNQIQACSSNTLENDLYLNPYGGTVHIGNGSHNNNMTIHGDLTVSGTITNGSINAATASKLRSGSTDYSVGSSTAPVYFSGGIPVACGNSLAVNITGNAATASVATKLGAGAGSSTKPVYVKSDGAVAAITTTDNTSAAALANNNSNLVTARSVYFALPTINGAHNYTSSTTIYAPSALGTGNYVLGMNSAGSAMEWKNQADLRPVYSATGGTSQPIYINSSGAFAAGNSYVPTTGGTFNGNIAATKYTGGAELTGTPTAPTAAAGTNTTQIATTAFVKSAISTASASYSFGKEETITGNGSTTAFAISHAFNTRDVIVQVYDLTDYKTVECDVTRTSTTQVTVEFNTAPASGKTYRVLITATQLHY